MLTKRLLSIVFMCGLTSCLWACGSDDDDDNDTSGTGGRDADTGGRDADTGGSDGDAGRRSATETGGRGSGDGGSDGEGGRADTGGTDAGGAAGAAGEQVAGKGGTDTGGAAGAAGDQVAGKGGMAGGAGEGGSAGTVMTAGQGGDTPIGGMGGATSGQGGIAGAAGGPSVMTIEEACTSACTAISDAECPYAAYCLGTCTDHHSALVTDSASSLPAFEEVIRCYADTEAGDWTCNAYSILVPALPNAGVCDAEMCAWQCAEYARGSAAPVYDVDVLATCQPCP